MPRFEDTPSDAEIWAELGVIDATLRGEAVDPAYAELAEVALLLADERPPAPRAEFVRALDARAARRFEPEPRASVAGAAGGARNPGAGAWLSSALAQPFRRPALGAGLTAVLAVAVAAVIVLPGSSSNSLSGSSNASTEKTPVTSAASPATHRAVTGTGGSSSGAPLGAVAPSSSASNGSASTAEGVNGRSNGGGYSLKAAPLHASKLSATAAPTPDTSGRKVVQSAQIQLGTANRRIDTVSQEVFDVVGQENGIVEHSRITAAAGGGATSFASFTLSIPTANLQSAMTRLSSLRYANVISREQATQDVTDQYNDERRALADAQALRTSLLKQLQNADTTVAIDSLQAQIRYAESEIRADERNLNHLNHRISYSTLSVEINAQSVVFPIGARHSHAFTIARGAHDALRVLVVAAGLVLIVLAALVPLGLVAALLIWIGYWVRQRRREQALDQP